MENTHKITPHLWFNHEANEAVQFYISIFPDSTILYKNTIHEVPTPTGDCDIFSFELSGQPFMAINAGPEFIKNPSISFIVNFDSTKTDDALKNLDMLWEKLSNDGKVLMELDKYPFSERYGWIQDQYGVSWQLILSDPQGEDRPSIITSLLFTGDGAGHAEEAANFYISLFRNSQFGTIARYGKGQEPDKEGTIMFCDFMLDGQWFAAMDSAHKHDFSFNEAISLLIPCETQEEIDYFWEKLSVDPDAEQCGWLRDRFGVSWQVYPSVMGKMMMNGTEEQRARVTQAFLQMKKYDIDKLQKAYNGQ